MKVYLYQAGAKTEVEVPYAKAQLLPEVVYRLSKDGYKFYRRGYADNSTTYYETEALHVPEN